MMNDMDDTLEYLRKENKRLYLLIESIRENLKIIMEKTMKDPAGEAELNARAEVVHRESLKALWRIGGLR